MDRIKLVDIKLGFYIFLTIQLLLYFFINLYCFPLSKDESEVLSEFQKIKDPNIVNVLWFSRGVKKTYGLEVDVKLRKNGLILEEIQEHYQNQADVNGWIKEIKKKNESELYENYVKGNLRFYIYSKQGDDETYKINVSKNRKGNNDDDK